VAESFSRDDGQDGRRAFFKAPDHRSPTTRFLQMAQVQLENVRKEYDNGFVAVHDATFTIADGEFVVLVGPSGCGKSTTLRMIAGLEEITSGTLRIGERVVNNVPPKERDIAMVFQNYALYPHLNVFENMAFGLRLRRYPSAQIDERVREASRLLDLDEVLERKPKALSGGQRQRVALGRAIVRKPQVFLFDEPLSNLDAKLRVQTRTEISRLHRRLGATTVYVTHDQVEAMTMGDRIVVLKDGLIQQIAPPLELYERPANRFVAGFIGSPAMNFLEGNAHREGEALLFGDDDDLRIPLPIARRNGDAGAVSLGIRPEGLTVVPGPGDGVMDMTVELLEPMGNEIFVHARRGRHTVVARVPPQPLPAPGESISLRVETERTHLFDAETGERIGA
jgi:multiple sugar transport system ATP-binding protein